MNHKIKEFHKLSPDIFNTYINNFMTIYMYIIVKMTVIYYNRRYCNKPLDSIKNI